jgi:hypothetical protein
MAWKEEMHEDDFPAGQADQALRSLFDALMGKSLA